MTAPDRGAALSVAARVNAPRETYDFETAAGVNSPDEFRDAELALAEALWDRQTGRLLVVGANYGVPGVLLADASRGVTMTESSARAARLCEANAERNGVGDTTTVATVADPRALEARGVGEQAAGFDAAAYAPKPYTPLAVAKERLVAALERLRPGGRLFVAAREQTGLGGFSDTLVAAADSVETVAEYGDCTVLGVTRPPSFDAPSFVEPRTVRPTVDAVSLSLVSVPGVFAASALDHGTRLLLQTASVDATDRVLDLCCGYGAMGVWAAKTGVSAVTLTDDDRLATRCAECSLTASGVEASVVTADGAGGIDGRRFDTILCNPPTHAGDSVLRDLFDGARRVLSGDGTLWVVHHGDLDLRPHLSAAGFARTTRRATGEEHVVLAAVA